jgi:MFS family permease
MAAVSAPGRRRGWSTLLVTVSAAVGSLLFGYDTGVIAGALLYIKPEFGLEDEPALEGLVVSATLVGACLGAFAGGALSDRFGRRRPLFFTAALFTAGGLLMALAPAVAWLIVGRFVVGVAIGVSGAIIPVYIAECAPADVRGRLATYPQLFVSLGIFTSYLVDFAVSLTESGSWRLMLGLSVVPAVVQFLLLLWLPESPRWLLQQGRGAEAVAVLRRLRETSEVSDELGEMAAALQREGRLPVAAARAVHEAAPLLLAEDSKDAAASSINAIASPSSTGDVADSAVRPPPSRTWADVRALLRRADVRKALLIGFLLQMFQQLSGAQSPSVGRGRRVTGS